ncbi:hypothetical protein D3C72_2127500 [compost metagenome]
MMTQVAMSALVASASARVTTEMASSGRPAARPKMTGVVQGRTSRRIVKAVPSCQGRALLIGL